MCDAIIRPMGYPEYRIRICKNCIANLAAETPVVPLTLARLDAQMSLLGEAVAGVFLGLYEVEGECAEISELERGYRRRSLVEVLYDLYERLGGILRISRVDPLYIPSARAFLLRGAIGCAISSQLRDWEARRRLRTVYEDIGELMGLYLPNHKIDVSRLRTTRRGLLERVRGLIPTALTIYHRGVQGFMGALGSRQRGECRIHPAVEDPGVFVELPEGSFTFTNYTPKKLAEEFVGDEVECKRRGFMSSSLICQGSDGRIVVKIYEKMMAKWIPATLASPSEVRYLFTPRARMSNEYYWLRALRKAVETPRIHKLVVSGTRMMARDYIEGEPVLGQDNPDYWETVGSTLALIHKNGIVLGDPNPGNFIVDIESREAARVVDAEQARHYQSIGGAWDLAVFTVYGLIFGAKEDLIRRAIEAYREEDPELYRKHREVLEEGHGWGGIKLLGPVYLAAKRILLG